MRRPAFAVAPLIWMCVAASAQEEPTFRVDVRLVNVVVTVKNTQGAPVGDLEKQDFTVLAAGVPQQIAIFERQTDRPLSITLLFDASPSVAKELKFEQEAAVRFIRSMLGGGANLADRLAVYRFADEVEEIQGLTSSVERLEKAVLSIRTSGGTSVYDALYLAAQRLEGRQGRKVIVIVTDGGDTTSTTTFHQALEAAQLADAVVYSIIVVPITNDAGRNLRGENALKTMSAATGGLAFMQYSEQDMDRTFREIERDLRIQYLIGFYPQDLPASTERFRKIEVRVNRPGLRILARSGFYMDTSAERLTQAQPPVALEGGQPRERKKENKNPGKAPQAKKVPRSIP